MEKSIYFILLSCALQGDLVQKVSAEPYIVGGYNITIEEAPYQAFLQIQKGMERRSNKCGGSIISSQYILTTAHCLVGITRITARVGSTYRNSGGTQYTPEELIMHPQYNPKTHDYDVGLIRFRNINLDGVTTNIILLPPLGKDVAPGTVLIVSGWGAIYENGPSSEHLMAVQLPVLSNGKCTEYYGQITPRMICVGALEGGKDACRGDSGGPAVTKDGIQVGIVSIGRGCARPNIPSVYSKVSSVRNWIKEISGV